MLPRRPQLADVTQEGEAKLGWEAPRGARVVKPWRARRRSRGAAAGGYRRHAGRYWGCLHTTRANRLAESLILSPRQLALLSPTAAWE